jgi:putative OPT family oligopeptide transporter
MDDTRAIGAAASGRRGELPAGESTLRAWALGLGLSALLGAANVYLGLKVGMTVSASIPAAVLAMLILRRVLRGGTVLEANLVQTAASAGESLAAGILFTVPALVLIGFWQEFDYWTTALIAIAGGWLGVLFMIPMRRVFIEESPELPFPEGVACASVLRAGMEASGPGAAKAVVEGGLLGGLVKLAVGQLGLASGVLEHAALVAGRPFFVGAEVSPALVAVGVIVRLEVAAQIFLGGAIGWWVVLPALVELAPLLAPASAALATALDPGAATAPAERAFALWSHGVRYVGVGAMAVGGLAALVRVRAGLARAVGELRLGWAARADGGTSADLSGRWILFLSAVAIGSTALLYLRFTGAIGIALVATALMAVACFFFVGVASYIVGLVGNSNSPVSGMTITAVLATGAVLFLAGYTGMQGMVATLGVAAVVCCAACTAGDICNDLKTGSLVGATPWRQQQIQLAGVVVAALVMAPVLQLLDDAYGIGSRELAAPQASLFASLARGFFGDESLPWGLVGLGAGLGGAVLALDAVQARRPGALRLHLMPIAVGMYLPLGLSLPILVGGILEGLARRRRQAAGPGAESGVLFASGAVAGEALVGVGLALLVALGFERMEWGGAWQGLGAVLAALVLLAAFGRAVRADRVA